MTLVSQTTGLAKCKYMCQHFDYDTINGGSKAEQQRRWKSLVKEIVAADILSNQTETALTTIAHGDYLLRPIEFIKKSDRCCLITEYANGPRLSDILKIRKESGQFVRLDHVPSFSKQE